MLTKEMLVEALKGFHIEKDSILLVHSSLKALGPIDGGAETVIAALEETVSEGTLVFPTFASKNWEHVFEEWHMDRPSDVGYITEVFRKQEGSLRSDNPTHSVAARGKLAKTLTQDNLKEGPRPGPYGDYAFAHGSPFQKMYDSREKYGVKCYVMFWGVTTSPMTFKHLIEHRWIEELLNSVKDEAKREEFSARLSKYPAYAPYVWPMYSTRAFGPKMAEAGVAKIIPVGEGEIICGDAKECVDFVDKTLRENVFTMTVEGFQQWYREISEYIASEENK